MDLPLVFQVGIRLVSRKHEGQRIALPGSWLIRKIDAGTKCAPDAIRARVCALAVSGAGIVNATRFIVLKESRLERRLPDRIE